MSAQEKEVVDFRFKDREFDGYVHNVVFRRRDGTEICTPVSALSDVKKRLEAMRSDTPMESWLSKANAALAIR